MYTLLNSEEHIMTRAMQPTIGLYIGLYVLLLHGSIGFD